MYARFPRQSTPHGRLRPSAMSRATPLTIWGTSITPSTIATIGSDITTRTSTALDAIDVIHRIICWPVLLVPVEQHDQVVLELLRESGHRTFRLASQILHAYRMVHKINTDRLYEMHGTPGGTMRDPEF
eukprot:COSAG02_NODE_1078_length_14712_cov_9.462054_11_plen_129_part_00